MAKIDLSGSRYKGKVGLYLDREIAFDVQAKAGIKVTPDRSWSSNFGYRYIITKAAAMKLIRTYGSAVTVYGEPINPADYI